MDFSVAGTSLYGCCLNIAIPATITGIVYAFVSELSQEKRAAILRNNDMPTFLVSIFIILFVLTCFLLLYLTRNFYAL